MRRTVLTIRDGGLTGLMLVLLVGVTSCTADNSVLSDCQVLPTPIDADTILSPGCYVVEESVTITNDAMLTVQPGVTIYFKRGTGMTVSSDGKLQAVGTATAPIVFTGELPLRGYWNGLHFNMSDSTANTLEHVTIEYGGGYDFYSFFAREEARANLVLSGTGSTSTRVSINNCTLRESAGVGFYTGAEVAIETFSENTITDNAVGAGFTAASVLSFLGGDNTYSGNDVDVVFVSGEDVFADQTWSAIDADYVFISGMWVQAALTIEPGVSLKFRSGTELSVLASGSLSAVGTAEAPILFTGEVAEPGAWYGLFFRSSDSPLNRLEHVTVQYGGGNFFPGEPRANLMVKQSQITVTNSTLSNAYGWGVWVSNDSTVNADLETANSILGNSSGDVYLQP